MKTNEIYVRFQSISVYKLVMPAKPIEDAATTRCNRNTCDNNQRSS